MQIQELRRLLDERYNSIERLIKELEKAMKNQPEGRIRISHSHGTTYYYLVDNSNRNGHILSVDELPLIKKIAQFNYYEKLLKSAYQERNILSSLKRHYDTNLLENIYSNLKDDRKLLIKPLILSDDKFMEDWLSKPYKRKVMTDETPFYLTNKGDKVRSKSEKIIADALFAKNIPYRYECQLHLKYANMTIYPDFTILRMSDRTEIYLEHYGKLSESEYAQSAVQRNNAYAHDGIILGERLFVTMECGRIPIDTEALDTMIEALFR